MRKTVFVAAARTGAAFILEDGRSLTVIDLEGMQAADLVTFASPDHREKLSTGATIDGNGSIAHGIGREVLSDRYRGMLLLAADTVGRHDLLHPACSPAMYRRQYGIGEDHPSCLVNLARALSRFGMAREDIPTPLNLFTNSRVDADGSIRVDKPIS